MFLLDTDVISETMRPAPERRVVSWLDEQVAETLYLSTISLAELLLGVAILPNGRRKSGLGEALNTNVKALFGQRILSFDEIAAHAYAAIIGEARSRDRAIGAADGMIAAIAWANGLTVATRDVEPFEAAGMPVVNPWVV